ncbi:MAG: PilZ domain-containing protein [Deltaproteobacteria bacterium]|nr:PilZ domain-containing protein [Deltaproteobacteria bacterium]
MSPESGAGMRKERRKYARIATDQVISFSMLESRDQLAVGKDVSSGGIRFHAIGCEINAGERIRVTFNVGRRTIAADGLVAWSTELDAVTLDVGLEFESLDPEVARLLDEIGEE